MTIELRSDRLAIFSAVVAAGTVSRAAERLGLAQSSVSQTLAVLERDVGEPLFARVGRTLTLTEAGRVLHARGGAALAALEAARQALLDLRAEVSGRLAVGASDTLATHLLPPALAAFRRAHPAVELHLENRPSPTIARQVAARELDVGVVSLPLPDEPATRELTQVPLQPLRDVAIVPPRHPLAKRARVRVVDLVGVPLLLLDETTGQRAWLEHLFRAHGVAPLVVMDMSSVEVIKRLVELGFGCSIIPALALSRHDRLAARPLVGVSADRRVGLVVPPAPSRATRAFVDTARRVLRRPGAKRR